MGSRGTERTPANEDVEEGVGAVFADSRLPEEERGQDGGVQGSGPLAEVEAEEAEVKLRRGLKARAVEAGEEGEEESEPFLELAAAAASGACLEKVLEDKTVTDVKRGARNKGVWTEWNAANPPRVFTSEGTRQWLE